MVGESAEYAQRMGGSGDSTRALDTSFSWWSIPWVPETDLVTQIHSLSACSAFSSRPWVCHGDHGKRPCPWSSQPRQGPQGLLCSVSTRPPGGLEGPGAGALGPRAQGSNVRRPGLLAAKRTELNLRGQNGCRHGTVGSSGHCREEEELQCGCPR